MENNTDLAALLPQPSGGPAVEETPASTTSTESSGAPTAELAPVETPIGAVAIQSKTIDPGACPFVPEAFDPGPADRRPYAIDPQDNLLPTTPSFVSDFVYSMKGTESPTIFNLLAALYTVSVMSARQASFKWQMGSFFPNMYLLLVGPPAGPHKGAALGRASRIIERLPTTIMEVAPNRLLASEKTLSCISSRATSEGIYKALAPRKGIFVLPNGAIHRQDFGSVAYVWAPEFATFLNNKKYTEGLVDALTNWYDCLDKDSETLSTRKGKALRNIYFCLAGALTPTHLQRSLPEEAFTGGFMSRVILCCQERPFQFYSKPRAFPGYPDESELVHKLTWLAYNDRGEYDFTPEADVFYDQFYMESRAKTLEHSGDTRAYARLRHEHLVIRMAMLLRMAEYREGHDVTIDNIKDAIKILEYTYSTQGAATEAIGANETAQLYLKVRRYIYEKGHVQRQTLQRRFSKEGLLSQQLSTILRQLHEQGEIKFFLNGSERAVHIPSTNTQEVYEWSNGPIGEDD